jgi:hypothetical protein
MIKTIKTFFYALFVVFILLDFLTPMRDHPVFWWHYIPGFDAVFGLVACLLIIKGTKAMAKHWLQRQENYYD